MEVMTDTAGTVACTHLFLNWINYWWLVLYPLCNSSCRSCICRNDNNMACF